MKKLLSTIMALVMLLSLVPMAVAEEGETAKWSETKSEKHVAQVGDMFYETLADAVASVPVDGTETTITLLNNAEVENYIAINGGKNIVLDLNGHDVVHNGNYLFDVYNAKFHVTGEGTLFENVKDGYAPIIARGSATDTADYTVITIDKGVTLKGDYTGIFVAKDAGNGYHNYGLVINMFGTIDMGAVADGYHYSGMYVNGTNTVSDGNVMTINLDGATIKNCAGAGIYAAGYAKWNITNSSITGGDTGIEIRAGELTLNDCALEATAEEFSCVPNGNGATTVGAAIAIAQHTTKLDTAVTINGGSFKGVKALNESNPQKNDAESVKKVSVAVNGGTFNGDISAEDVTGFIKSGAFTDLANAVKYAADGATIKLAGDATGDIVIPAGKTITLDLGGHKLTNVKSHTIVNNGTLTITGTGTVDNVTNDMAALYNKGTATLNGGTFERSKEAGVDSDNDGGNSFYTILNHGLMTVNEGVVVNNKGHYSSLFENGYYDYKNQDGVEKPGLKINGGTFDGGLNTIKNDDNATLVINNGTFKNYTQACVQNHHVAEINGGEYIGNKAAAVLMCGVCKTVDETHDRHVMSITDGNFKGALTVTVGKLTIKGGTFTVDPSKFVTDANLVAVPNVGKTEYTVQPKTSQEGNATITTEVSEDGKTVTETKTDGNTVTKTETNVDTGVKTETKTETKVEGNVMTKTETVTEKNAAGVTTKATETVTTEKTENGGKTTVVTEKDTLNKTETTEVTGVTAPTTASDVTLDVKNTTNVAVNKASMTALKGDTVKDVVIETKDATLKLDKTAVKTMESKVEDNDKMKLDITVTEEKNATTTEIEKVKVEVTAKNEAGQNVFPKDTENTNGLINITIPYNGNAKYLDLWYIAANASATYMGRFPVVNGFVSFDVKHFSQYDLIPVASSGSSVIKTGAGSSAASTTQTVTTDLTPGSITKVTVDGKVVDAKYYTVSGSNVTFTAEFLKTLKNGSHTVTVENATKIAKGVFTVNNPTTAQSPTTADAGIALYAGMAIASVMGTGVVFTSRKRKNH